MAGRTLVCVTLVVGVMASPLLHESELIAMGLDRTCATWNMTVSKVGCKEPGPIPSGGKCTTVCLPGYTASVEFLTCNDGLYTPDPSEFFCVANPCPVPLGIEHVDQDHPCVEHYGDFIPSGSTCTSHCQDGYRPWPPSLRCLEGATTFNGTNASTFRCIGIASACKIELTNPDGVLGSASDGLEACDLARGALDLDTECGVKCDEGYVQKGTRSKVTCSAATGTTSTDIRCEEKTCSLPDSLGSNVEGNSTGSTPCVAGQVLPSRASCAVQCSPGYDANATVFKYSCLKGVRTSADLTCTPKNCGPPPASSLPNNSSFDECGTLFTSKPCVASCRKGYSGTPQTFSCGTSGSWVTSGETLVCKPNECVALPDLAASHATFETMCTHLSDFTCKASCNAGFVGESVEYKCAIDGNWTGAPPECKETLCQVNQHVVKHKCENCPIGTVKAMGDGAGGADTSCDECPEDKYRPQDFETCKQCPANSSTNGLRSSTEIAACLCVPGYSGKYVSEQQGSCSACDLHTYKPSFGASACTKCPAHATTTDVAQVNITACACEVGYTGSMLSEAPGCSACPHDTFKDVRGSSVCQSCPSHSSTDGSSAVSLRGGCKCAPGYTGDLSVSGSSCEPCPPNTFKAGFGTANCVPCPNNSTSPAESGEMSACVCDVGYTRVDLGNGSHKCAANKCNIQSISSLVGANIVACDGKTTTETCEVSCRRGYTGNPSTFSCSTNGNFIGAITCQPDPCNMPQPVVGVSFKGCVGVTTDSKCNVSCAAGFEGNPTAFTCQSDARIHGDLPECIALPCNPPQPEEGYDFKDCDGVTTFQTCTLKCGLGYHAHGTTKQTETLTCLDTGFVSTRTLECELSHCQPPSNIVGVDFTVLTPPLEVGAKKQINCEPGYSTTFSTSLHSFIPFSNAEASIQPGTEHAVVAKPRQTNLMVRPALSGTAFAISLALTDGRFLRNKVGLLSFEDYQDTKVFQESASYFLERSPLGKDSWMLRSVDFPSRYIRVKDSQLVLQPADAEDNIELFNQSATFSMNPVASALPATLPSIYSCARGGYFIGVPPACNPNTCAKHQPVQGVVFDNCTGAKTHEKCVAVCARGYSKDEGSGDGVLTCERDGFLDGELPVCTPNECEAQKFPARIDSTGCDHKKTGEQCSVKCEPGYSASAPILRKFGTLADLNLPPWAAGTDSGCQPCGTGGFAQFPCIRGDPVTPCRNWCASTRGCNYFSVITSGDSFGYCCRLTGIPPRDSSTGDFELHSMNADLVPVQLSAPAKNLDDLRGVCSEFLGLGLASLRGKNKLETIADLLQSQSIASGVPFGYRLDPKSAFIDFVDPFTVLNPILTKANSDTVSSFSGQRAWTTESTNLLVGLQRGELSTLNYAGVQTVVCERTFTCLDTGKLFGELPTCTANPCTLPVNTGTDFGQCFGLKTGESCDVVCHANRQNVSTPYDLAEAFRGPMVSHSFMPYLPSGNLSVALNAKVIDDLDSWPRGNLATFGGRIEDCCSGAVEIFTQSDERVGCRAHSGRFAFGVGSVCDTSDAPLMSQCKFSKDVYYSVSVWTDGTNFKMFVDGELVASAQKRFLPTLSDPQRGFQMSFLSSCHTSIKNFVSSEVQYAKVWTEDAKSHLVCQPDGNFAGNIPCAQTKCPVPQLPLGIDFSNCSNKRTGETCRVSCHDGSPSIDLTFSQPETLTDPKLAVNVTRIPRGTVNMGFTIRATGGDTDWSFQNIFIIGGDESACCGGGTFAFTTTHDVGCPENSGLFAIGYGTACMRDAVLTGCVFEPGVTYDVHIVQSSENTKIIVDGSELASTDQHYHLERIGKSVISFLSGCHGKVLAPFEGELSDFEIFSEIAQYTLTCVSNGTFVGDRPTCLERNCRPPARSSGIDFSDCSRRKHGESCIARCSPGFSEDGKGSNDVRNDAVLWLESAEISPGKWLDHRGDLFAGRFSVIPHNLKYDAKLGGILLNSDDTFVKVDGLDISPAAMPEVTLEAWIKLDKVANPRGWLISNDDETYARGIMLHNAEFGGEDLVPSLALGVGKVYHSKLGAPLVGEWIHVVACFGVSGVSHLYVNGVVEAVHHESRDQDLALDSLIVGRHPTAEGQFVSGVLASLRVYDEFLDADSVKQLFRKGRTFNPVVPPSAPTSVDPRLSSLVWLQASDITGTAWPDHRGSGHRSPDYSVVVNAKYDQETRGLRIENDTTYALIKNIDIGPSTFPKLSIEVWFRLASAKPQGWLVSHDTGGFDRSLVAHDHSFGDGASAMGVGYIYESNAEHVEIGEWIHLVGVWEQFGECRLYKNGLPFLATKCTNDREALDFIVIGKHPTLPNFSINGTIATVRIYGHSLSSLEVSELYRMGDPAVPISSAESLISSSWINLEARDVSSDQWPDHRGSQQKPSFAVNVHDAHFDNNQKALRMGPTSRVTISEMNINPSANSDITLELWVKIRAISHTNKGWVFGTGINAGSRSLFLHDASFGPGSHIQSPGMSAGKLYQSAHEFPPTNEWTHIVGVFTQSGPSFFFLNGVPERVSLSAVNVDGSHDVILGSQDSSNFLDGWVSVARVYRMALTSADVLALFRAGHYASEPARLASAAPMARTCDGDTLELACTGGKTIHITSAMYGRTSNDVCGHGATTTCRASSSLNIVMSHCEGKPSCSLKTLAKEFGTDPCPGTKKYLEVDFECLGANPPTLVPGDVRRNSLIWVESRDVILVNKVQTLHDHRGSAFAQGLDIRFMNFVQIESQGMRFGGGSFIELRGFDFSELSLPELSVEIWFMLESHTESRGFLFGTGPTAEDRSVYLHDETQHDGKQTLLAGHGPVSHEFGSIETGQWHHVIAVWRNHGASTLYKNGLALTTSGPKVTKAAADVLLVGSSGVDFVNGWVSSVRVYSYALQPLEVESLLLQHPKPAAWMEVVEDSAELFTCSSDGQFYGSNPVCRKNTCNAPIPQVGVDFSACKGLKTGETCMAKCASGFEGEIITFDKPSQRHCGTSQGFDVLKGVTLQQCKLACENGVMNCKNNCEKRPASNAGKCNALEYNQANKLCTIHVGCDSATGSESGVQFIELSRSLTSPFMCGFDGQFQGVAPTCTRSLPTGSNLACEGQSVSLACPENSNVFVLGATYGRLRPSPCSGNVSVTDCSSPTALSVVKRQCRNRQSCQIQASNDNFGGDPCPGVSKYLEVNYECRALESRPSRTLEVCENKDLELACSGNSVIQIDKVMYGRQEFDTCPCGDRANVHCSFENASVVVKHECEGKSHCTLSASVEAMGSDPCPGTSKYLDVEFQCVKPAAQHACESETLQIKCDYSRNELIHIRSANFGRTSPEVCKSDKLKADTQCRSPNAMQVAVTACEGRTECNLISATAAFGDACPGIPKYLEVAHECVASPPSVRTCHDHSAVLACSAGKQIHVTRAAYGRTSSTECPAPEGQQVDSQCGSVSVLEVAQNYCEGSARCEFDVTTKVLQHDDLCPDSLPYLELDYLCVAAPPEGLTCEGGSFKIDCGDEKTVNVTSVSFGRTAFELCPHPARANLNCVTPNALEVARKACAGKQKCAVDSSVEVFGDACPGTYKYLTIEHDCV